MRATMEESATTLEKVLELARQHAPDAEATVHVTAERSANTRYARSEITSTGDAEETDVRVHLAFGKRHASTSTNQTDAASLKAAIERAAAMARISPEDPESMPPLGKQVYADVPSSFDEATAALDAGARLAGVRASLAAADGAGHTAAGYFEHGARLSTIGTSAGLRAQHRRTEVKLTATARSRDGSGSGWGGGASHRVGEVDAALIGKAAADKATKTQKPAKLAAGKYTVILEPAAVAELMTFLGNALDARAADEGRSFFTKPGGGTRVGERLFAEGVTLTTSPSDPATPGAPFDGEGFPLQPATWIDKGALSGLRYSRYWASKQGKAPTGRHATWHLHGGTSDGVTALLAGVQRGLLVTRFWYTRWVDPRTMLITGLTRDGVLLVENGAIVGPVQNFRFNESPVTMLKNVDAMTRATVVTPGGGDTWRVPAIRTHEFNFASVSDAV